MSGLFDLYDKLVYFWKIHSQFSNNVTRLLPVDSVVGAATFHPVCFFDCLLKN